MELISDRFKIGQKLRKKNLSSSKYGVEKTHLIVYSVPFGHRFTHIRVTHFVYDFACKVGHSNVCKPMVKWNTPMCDPAI